MSDTPSQHDSLATPRVLIARVMCVASLLAVAFLFALAVFFRLWHLENIPGVNGDEAWLGWKALRVVHGEPIQWTTFTGNLPNVFYFLPLVGLHAIFPASFLLLRIVAVVSGVLALVFNFLLCRRVFDRETAFFSTLLLAVLPVNIAYSRFGWEPSQMLGASVFVVYGSLLIVREEQRSRFWAVLSGLALAAAFLVHPMCTFLLPFPLIAVLVRWREKAWDVLLFKKRFVSLLFWGSVALLLVLFGRWKGVALLASFHDAANTRAAWPFVLGVLRLFSGTNVYRYISQGTGANFPAQDLIAALLIGFACVGGLFFSLRGLWTRSERVLFCAWTAGLFLFWAMLGTSGLAPNSERYALWMVLPGALLFSRTIAALVRLHPRTALPLRGGFLVLCFLMLAGFQQQYFQVFLRSGGQADPTFRTGTVEPKWAALQIVLEKQPRNRPFVIASSDWWVFWPMRYRAYGTPNLTMLHGEEMNSRDGAAKISRALKSGDLWFAEFSNSLTLSNLRAGLQQGGVEYQEYSAPAADGRPVVSVLRLHQK